MTEINVALPKVEAAIELAARGDGPAKEPRFDPTSMQHAVGQYRTTARWIIGAFAAIGSLLVASVPLAAVSGFDPTKSSLAALLWGAGLALGGVGLSITAVAATLVPRSVYPYDVSTQSANRVQRLFSSRRRVGYAIYKHHTTLLPAGISSTTQLGEGIENLELEILRGKAANSPTVGLESRQTEYENAYTQLQWILRFEKARNIFRLGLVGTIAGAIAVGVGIGLLLYGLEDPKQSAEIEKTEAEASKANAEASKANAEASKLTAESEGLGVDRAKLEDMKIEAEIEKLSAEAAKANAEAEKAMAETAELLGPPESGP